MIVIGRGVESNDYKCCWTGPAPGAGALRVPGAGGGQTWHGAHRGASDSGDGHPHAQEPAARDAAHEAQAARGRDQRVRHISRARMKTADVLSLVMQITFA